MSEKLLRTFSEEPTNRPSQAAVGTEGGLSDRVVYFNQSSEFLESLVQSGWTVPPGRAG